MLFKDITVLDENLEVKEHMHVGTKGDRIAYIGTAVPDEDFGEVYDGQGKLLMSGFYNAHGHSPMTLMRGYGENMVLQDWLNKRIFPFEDQLDSAAVYWGTLLSQAESMRYGIVSTSDMYYFIDDIAGAVAAAGTKANISRAIVQFDDSDPWAMPSMKEMERTAHAYREYLNGKIRMDGSIHAEYTSRPHTVKEVAAFTKENDMIMHIHISETKTEHEECKARYGKTPVEYFNDLGAWDMPALAAHCVWAESGDMDILREKGVTVASCPVSNTKLASGVCNVPELLKRGVKVALGTDSVASNNSLDFFEEMKFFATVSKMMYKDPTQVTPGETLYAATRAGALAQGRTDCGLLKEDYKADLIVVDISGPNMHPVHNLLNNLVYSASGKDVVLTMIDGKTVYRDNEYMTLDIEKVICEAEKSTQRLLRKLSL